MKKQLKLYVWEGVLTDYTDGIMFALAESPDHARELILKKCNLTSVVRDLRIEPVCVTKAEGFYLYGGG